MGFVDAPLELGCVCWTFALVEAAVSSVIAGN